MEEKKVSVIIPLYNRKHLIERCVRSVQNQTYRHLEIIIVDDGSTDEPDEVLAALAQDERVRVIRKPNGGVSSARNAGLDAATGEYVQFLDSDDMLMQRAVELSVQTAEKYHVECVVFRKCSTKEFTVSVSEDTTAPEVLSEVDCVVETSRRGAQCVPWNKLYNRKLLGDIRFKSGVSMGEDLIFNLSYLSICRGIAFIQQPLYCYETDTADSLCRRYDDHCMEDIRAQWNTVREYLLRAKSPEMEQYWSRFFWICYIEAVRKLCLKSGYSLKRVQQRLKEWREDEMIRSFPISAMPSLPEFRLLHAGFFRLMWVVIHLRHVKDVLRARFF